jgi:hypothetical protein
MSKLRRIGRAVKVTHGATGNQRTGGRTGTLPAFTSIEGTHGVAISGARRISIPQQKTRPGGQQRIQTV